MRLHRYIYTTLILLATGNFAVNAQDVKPPEKTVSEEIEIIRPYKPVLAEAFKLRRSPDLDNLQTYKAKFNYLLTDRKLELNSDIQKLQAQQLAAVHATELINNYVKGGFGSLGTLLAEAYVNIGKDEGLQTGAFFRHFSQQGKLLKQNENTQQFTLFGRSIGDKVTLNGRINYQRHGLYFYGFNELNPNFNPNPEKQLFNFVELEGEIINKFSTDEDAVSYAAKANGYLFNDKFDAKEQLVTLSGYLNKRINSFNLGLATAAELGSTKDFSTKVANNLFRLNPYIKLQTNGINITAGINMVQAFGTTSKARIFPAVTADFDLIPGFLSLFGEVKGDVNRNTLKSFTDENPFLNSNINMQNTIEKLSISGGIKGNGGPGFGYKARFYSKNLNDMPLFVNNFVNPTKFDVIYDYGVTKLTGLEGEITVQVSDNLKWTGKVNIDDYKPAIETASYYKPQLKVSSNFLINFNKKLTFNADVVIQDDSKAKIFLANPLTNGSSSYPSTPDTTIEGIIKIKGFVDLGVGANYKINERFGLFAKANNLLNTNYNKYLYYKVNGINIFAGLSYSF